MTLENHQQIENVQQYYEILRSRQKQIIGIIKDTSRMVAKLDSHQNSADLQPPAAVSFEKNVDHGIRLAFSMINALANILDEQMNALNIWERILEEERKTSPAASNSDFELQDYYEITSN